MELRTGDIIVFRHRYLMMRVVNVLS
ncbi:MAG: hypothetical protein ACI8UP_004086, partial [Porticoccaceae bacterium]